MYDDDQRPHSNRPAVHLLDELESIKGALTDDREADTELPLLPTNIPLLDDMVIDNLDRNANLLNIEHIFDDAIADAAPAAAAPPMQFPRFTLDVDISDDSEIVAAAPSRTPLFTPPTSLPPVVSTPSPARVRPDYSREVLIQELVDEFIPRIEAALHNRLRELDDTELRHLKEPK